MELKKISQENDRSGVKVSMLATFEDINVASDEEFENLVDGTKQMLGSGLVGYVTGKHKDGVTLEFLGCKTPHNL